MKTSIHAGIRLSLNGGLLKKARTSYLTPSFIYRMQGKSFTQLDLGVNYHIDPISVGIWYRGKPFEDDKLFSEIAIVSGFPELKEFALKYIQGKEPLPLEESLLKAGLKLEDGKISEVQNPTPEQQKLRKDWLHEIKLQNNQSTR